MNIPLLPISTYDTDERLHAFLHSIQIQLTPNEARRIVAILNRNPTPVELKIFDIEWSEHCSYKSSREILKRLPTRASNVLIGPGEDAGIITFTRIHNREYAIVIAHESHNHPSQILPTEGAATGIGGVVRDVACMGAHVCGLADCLRFGNPYGSNPAKTRWIINGVIDGIWQYGNALGVPNLSGDVCFDSTYDDNCLVNVICLGIVRRDHIIRSAVPEAARTEPYDLIVIGKPVDGTGYGGVTFASDILSTQQEERNLGAIQIPDPYLANILIMNKANRMMFDMAFDKGISIGMKDLGGGGLACASSELCAAAGFGADICLDSVPASIEGLTPEMIACCETQERFILSVPRSFSADVLRIYNEIWELPREANGARASIIGTVLSDPIYRLWFHGEQVCEIPIKELTAPVCQKRPSISAAAPDIENNAPSFSGQKLGDSISQIFSSVNVASRYPIYRHYDTEVQGVTVIRPGEGDAGVIAPLTFLEGSHAGIALGVGGNPFIGALDPYWGAAFATAEAMRNVIAVGSIPRAITDCMNFGNPERPEIMWQFERAVQGISDAARFLWQIGTHAEPVPVVSGNVSFYNESSSGQAIHPSPVISCVGTMDDCRKAVTVGLKEENSTIVMVGQRRPVLGGSVYYREIWGINGTETPVIDWEQERREMHAVAEILHHNLALSCHDISDGGMVVALIEMCFSHRRKVPFGLDVNFKMKALSPEQFLFSENGGFLLEIPPQNLHLVYEILEKSGAYGIVAGTVTRSGTLTIRHSGKRLVNIPLEQLRIKWLQALDHTIH